MKSSALALGLALSLLAAPQQWQFATSGYRYEFPRDYFNHPEYQTEWWYYTGNLRAPDGHRFGFELTFFRQAAHLSPTQIAASTPTWRPGEIYLAHLALSDIDGHQFFHTERLNRAGPGLAGSSLEARRYWNGNWQVRWSDLQTGQQHLTAVCDRFSLELNLRPSKPVAIQGQNGISRKGPLPGEASHYLSFTRLQASGELAGWNHRTTSVEGLAWMDHEFFTDVSDPALAGWDWFAIQLNNGEDLMLYRLRRKDTAADSFSSGEYIDAQGHAHFLAAADFSLVPGETWQSAASGAHYPIAWSISVPSLALNLTERTALADQELFSTRSYAPTYWEGAVTYTGHMHGQPVEGVGYLEMTGYTPSLTGSPAQALAPQ